MNPLLNKLLALISPPRRMEYMAVDEDLKILEASWDVQRFADCPERVIKGKDVRLGFPEFIGIEDILTAVLTGEQNSFELRGLARFLDRNEPLYIDISIVADRDEKSLQARLIILLEDVTERMVLQQSLTQRANETSLLAHTLTEYKRYIDKVFTSMAEALLVTTNSGNIKKVNQAAQDLFGYSEWELINQPISSIILDEDFLRQSRDRYSIERGKAFKNVKVVCQTKRGEHIYLEFSCSAIETDIEDFQDFIYVCREIG
ncbi:PAS domain-containing protein [Argonema galeatum]|uniref:PAS domain-containing protein n=1 Tax=Argonema galeatum TaxID=2942762 RepID=UPI002012E783|nr:PAS domain-containing protein [Argonema galeatum]MCL1466069.1 PAS domain-containing protein [Argonema galeatum A003/A1]